ncbi:MAG: ribosome maturation factor RimM [Nitrosospira sp.]
MVVMGHVIGPFGVLGWLKIFPYTEYVSGLLDYPIWWLGVGNGEWREVRVVECDVHGRMLTAMLEHYSDRNAAMKLKGMQVAIPRSLLPALSKTGKDGYYWSDLIGLEVVNLQSEVLGKVAGLLETGANDVLQVKNLKEDGRERLIPFVAQVVIEVDLKACRIMVDWGMDY